MADDGSGEGIGPSGAFALAADGDVGAGAFEDVEGAFADDGGGEARVSARQTEAEVGEVGALIAGRCPVGFLAAEKRAEEQALDVHGRA